MSDGTASIPQTFVGELPVKTMDLSEMGFRERYRIALTSKGRKHERNSHLADNSCALERLVRKSEVIQSSHYKQS